MNKDMLHRTWKKLPTAIRKPAVLIVGVIIVTAGIAMLALPGPGWAAIFLGFAILATEFALAKRVQNKLVHILQAIIHFCKKLFSKNKHKNK